jgi:hypothetical protein
MSKQSALSIIMQSKKAVNISCIDRAKQYPPGTLHADGDKLFCTACNVTLDHTRKGTIDRHLETPLHSKKRMAAEKLQDSTLKRQCTIVSAFNRQTEARDSRNVGLFELVEAFTLSNIPLNKLDHPKLHEYLQVRERVNFRSIQKTFVTSEFFLDLQANIKNMGLLPTATVLRHDYLPKVQEVLQEELRAKVSSATSISIVTDEASDSQDRYVLHILFIPQILSTSSTSFLETSTLEVLCVDLVYLEVVNATTVSQAIMQCLNKYTVEFNKVCSIVTDNASYMTKAYGNLKGLLPNCVHITCNAHIMNLVGETWRKNFPEVDRLVASFKSIFSHCAARKQSYKNFMQQVTGTNEIPLPPVPVITRWGSWFATVEHHARYVDFYPQFIAFEVDNSHSTNALDELSRLLKNQDVIRDVKFIAENTKAIIDLLTWFEGRQVNVHKAYNRVMDLLAWASEKSVDPTIPPEHAKAFEDTASRLKQYYSLAPIGVRGGPTFRQQGLEFLKAVRLFDPQQAKVLSFDGFVEAIPSLQDNFIALSELPAYKAAVHELATDVSPFSYWCAYAYRFPQLSKLAYRYLCVPVNSVDAERSVSQYTRVNAPQRQQFTDKNLALQTMFAFNGSQ